MDPAFAPINGISLERYAELGALIDDVKDTPKEAEAIQAEGVAIADWDAAKAGWTARMQDMSLMGKVASAFMPLYQAALAKQSGGAASVSYEDFVAVSAAIKVVGFEAAIAACGLSMGDWTQVAGAWNTTMGQQIHQYAGHHGQINQEEARLRQPGQQPRKVTITRTAGAGMEAPAGAVAAAQGVGNPYAAGMGAQPMASSGQPGPFGDVMAAAMNTPAMQQSAQANAAIMANPLGFGLGQAAQVLTGGITAGSRVNIAWSDGNKYPANVLQAAPGQFLVQFDNGSQQWVPENTTSKA